MVMVLASIVVDADGILPGFHFEEGELLISLHWELQHSTHYRHFDWVGPTAEPPPPPRRPSTRTPPPPNGWQWKIEYGSTGRMLAQENSVFRTKVRQVGANVVKWLENNFHSYLHQMTDTVANAVENHVQLIMVIKWHVPLIKLLETCHSEDYY